MRTLLNGLVELLRKISLSIFIESVLIDGNEQDINEPININTIKEDIELCEFFII